MFVAILEETLTTENEEDRGSFLAIISLQNFLPPLLYIGLAGFSSQSGFWLVFSSQKEEREKERGRQRGWRKHG